MDATKTMVVVLGVLAAGCTPDAGSGSGGGIDVTAQAEGLDAPLDATPDAKAGAIYFLARDGGAIALMKVAGGAPATVAGGLGPARSLAIGGDGSALVVADGGLERVATTDGARARIVEAEDFDARGVDVVLEGGVETVFFTGVDPADGEVGVFRVPLAGGAVEVVSKGFGAADLDGVARASDGTVFASDLGGKVWRVQDGAAPEAVLTDIRVGDPAGVALLRDESTLLISSLSDTGTSQVILLNTADLTTSVFDDVIGANAASGGVHRARDTDVFAWCGVTGSGEGKVYKVDAT